MRNRTALLILILMPVLCLFSYSYSYADYIGKVPLRTLYLNDSGDTEDTSPRSEATLNPTTKGLNFHLVGNSDKTPYTYAIAEGDIAGHTPVRRFGINPDVGTAAETVDPTSDLYVYLTVAETLVIASTDGADTIGGLGLQVVFVQGLSATGVLQSETVGMQGTDNVSTTKEYLQVLAFYSNTVGDSFVNLGEVTLKAGINTVQRIEIGEGRSNFAIFCVPTGYTFYMTDWHGSEASSKGSDVSMWKKGSSYGWQKIRAVSVLDNDFRIPFDVPLRFESGECIEVRAVAIISGATVTSGFYGWMETN